MMREEILTRLLSARDETFAAFQRKLIPNVPPEAIIGVRTPFLRQYAKELSGQEGIGEFLKALPYPYHEENQLHAFLISGMKDYGSCLEATETFLPYIDNWETCDQLSPKVFRKHLRELPIPVRSWLRSSHVYTVRFAIGMLMEHYLDAAYRTEYPEMAAQVKSEEYYVNMMRAWYFATALAKQYASVLPYIEMRRLDRWTHNKAIQKAVESRRLSEEQKAHLKTLRY